MLVFGLRSWYSYSGGFLSPDDAVVAAKRAGATSVAFADLHEIAGYGEFMKACERHDVKAIAGIEMNVFYQGEARPLLFFADCPSNIPALFKVVASATLNEDGLSVDLRSGHFKDLLICTGGLKSHFYDFLFQKDIVGGQRFMSALGNTGARVIVGLDPGTASEYHIDALSQITNCPIVPYRPAILGSDADQLAFADIGALLKKNNSEPFLGIFPPVIRTMSHWAAEAQKTGAYSFRSDYERRFLEFDCRGYGISHAYPRDLNYYGLSTDEALEELRNRCSANLEVFFESNVRKTRATLPDDRCEQYRSRMDEELAVAEKMGIEKYLLTLADVVQLARDGKVPLGDGRGSSVNSLLCFLLKITQIDPVADDLPHERFLNPGRKGLPDIDIDIGRSFTKWFQEKVRANFPQSLYMRTFSRATLQRYLPLAMELKNIERSNIDELMSHLREKFGTAGGRIAARTFEEMCATHPEFTQELEKFPGCSTAMMQSIVGLLQTIGGRPVDCGVHVSGIAISPLPIVQLAPVIPVAQGKSVVRAIAVPFDEAEKKGIVKIDILSVDALDQIKGINLAIHKTGNDPLHADGSLLKQVHCEQVLDQGLVSGVFQLSKQASLVRELKIRSFNDLAYTLGLIRVVGNERDFEATRRVFASLPPDMKDVLGKITSKTRGAIIFQEQLSLALHTISGIPKEQCELIRRALAKKEDTSVFSSKTEGGSSELERGREDFIAGCARKFALPTDKAGPLFAAICHGGKYMLNEGHSRAYARIAEFQIVAKAEFTTETFIEMLKTLRREASGPTFRDNVAELIYETRVLGTEVLGLNLGRNPFTQVTGELVAAGNRRIHRQITLGLDIIPTITNGQCRVIHNAHGEGKRITPALLLSSGIRLNDEDVLKLIALGAFDSMESDRNKLVATYLPKYSGQCFKLPQTREAQREYLGFLTDDVHPGIEVARPGEPRTTVASSKVPDLNVEHNDRITLAGFIAEVGVPRRVGAAKRSKVTLTMSCYLGDKPVRVSRFFEKEQDAERFALKHKQISAFTPVLLPVVVSSKPNSPVYWNTKEEPVPCSPERLMMRREMSELISEVKNHVLTFALGVGEPLPQANEPEGVVRTR